MVTHIESPVYCILVFRFLLIMPERTLAAIMFTDMEGYTRLMQQDEKKAKQLCDLHRKALEEETEKRNGKIMQYYGDGSLSIYNSSIEAVACAIAVQERIKGKVNLRIGLHVGDIVKDEDGAIYGDGVNVASRIESMAISGAVLVSGKLHDDIKNQSNFSTEFLGSFELKNVVQPVEIFAITNSPLNVPDKQDMVGKGSPKQRSIAVLPFTNMSTDPENEYFSDGITEEILNALVKVEDLKVTARTSSFVFKGKEVDIREIGKILNVEYVLEGSVRKAGSKVRISAQLVSAVDGYHLWSETFDRNLEDIFTLQDEISKTITSHLRIELSLESHQKPLVKNPTDNIEVYNLFLKGKYYWNKWSPENARKAITYFEEAINLEPSFSSAYAALAGCYIFLAVSGNSRPDIAFPKALENAKMSIELAGNEADSISAIAMVKFLYEKNRSAARKFFEKALELNPKLAETHHYFSMFLCVVGDLESALKEIKTALNINPLSLNTIIHLADVYMYMNRLDDAMAEIDKVLEMDASFRMATEKKGWIYYFMGDMSKSLNTFKKYHKQTSSELKGLAGLGYVYGKTGKTEKANELIKRLDKRKSLDDEVILDMDYAVIYLGLNDLDNAFYHLEKAFEQNVGGLYISSDLLWVSVQNDPRFAPLAKKYKLI